MYYKKPANPLKKAGFEIEAEQIQKHIVWDPISKPAFFSGLAGFLYNLKRHIYT